MAPASDPATVASTGIIVCQCAPKVMPETECRSLEPRLCIANTTGIGVCPEIAIATEIWALKALDHGGARLHFAGDVRGHIETARQSYDAACALLVASILSPEHRVELRMLARKLLAALQPIGHPSGAELLAVSQAAGAIRQVIASR
jgi:hypothetical protein